MDITKQYVWATPDPDRVARVVAMRKNDKWVEVYKGERIFVHYSQMHYLSTKGLIVCEDDFSKYVFSTQEAAERCDDKFRLHINENRL
jgi:hypothetical protein